MLITTRIKSLSQVGITILLLLFINIGYTQINRVEYFVDTDPGFGNATSIPIASSADISNQSASINLSNVSGGFHNFFIRSRNSTGAWSISNQTPFFKANAVAAANISRVEYFVDTDPGFGKATSITIAPSANLANQPAVINLANVPDGFHNLFIRSRDAGGLWSISNQSPFFKTNGAAAANINRVEYFIDTDPGFGKATSIATSASNDVAEQNAIIDLSSITAGFHNLFIRSRDAGGKWSISNQSPFFKVAAAGVANIVKSEYFFDNNDPGFGLATPLLINPAAPVVDELAVPVNIGCLAVGPHTFFVRSLDMNGKWSITNSSEFSIAVVAPQAILITSSNATNPLCFGSSIQLSFDGGNCAFNPGNIFNVEISDAAGVFAAVAPIIGSVSGSFKTGTIEATFPPAITSGTYKLRVSSTSPVIKGTAGAGQYTISNTNCNGGTLLPGSIGSSQTVCSSSPPAQLTNILSAFTNSGDAIIYQWQDSTVGGSWKNSASANAASFQPAILVVNTWYRRTATAGTLTAISNEVAVTLIPSAGNPAIYGQNAWNFYAYDGVSVDSIAVSYRGFYTRSALNFNTANDFNGNANPGAATGYAGCPLAAPGNAWSLYARRQGFPTAPYILNINSHDDNVKVFKDGVELFSATCCNTAGATNISLGTLDASSRLDLRLSNAALSGNLQITLSQQALNPGSIGSNQTVCGAAVPALLSNNAPAFGGPSITQTYQWQDSIVGGTWKNIAFATNLFYQPSTLPVSTWFRRIAKSGVAIAASNEVAITVLVAAPPFTPGINLVNRTLTASALAAGTTGYQWFKDGLLINGATSQNFVVADASFGNFSVAYTNICFVGTASEAISVPIAKTNQNIVFTAVPAKTFGDAAFAVTANASSNLPISAYSVESGPATISGNTVTITGAGAIVIKAVQDGNATFKAAENTLAIVVNKAAASVQLTNLLQAYDGSPKQAVAITTPLGLNISVSYNGSTNSPTDAGNYTTVATITSPNYQGTANGILVISKAGQTIQLTNPGNKSYNDAPFHVSAITTSGLPVTLSLQTIPATGVAQVNGNSITMLGAGGTVTITASQAGNNNFNAAVNATTSFEVKAPEAKDVQPVSLLQPSTGCNLGLTASIKIKIRNAGSAPATNFPVSFKVGNDAAVIETFTGTIAAGADAEFTFTAKAIFAETGISYPVKITTALVGDERPVNDELLTSLIRFAPVELGISNDTAICAGGEATLRTFNARSSFWTGGPNNPVYVVKPVTTTTYNVLATDINGCLTKTLSVKVTVNPLPVVNAGADQTILRGSSITLLASGAQSFLWNNGVAVAANTVSPRETTTYSVAGTNQFGCTASDEVKVNVNFSAIDVSPGQLQFGGVVVNTISSANITLTNTGTFTETITGITGLGAPFTTVFTGPVILPAGSSLKISVVFAPVATLIYQNKITIASSAGNFDITLKGTGVNPAPAWTVTPASFNFGKVPINTNLTKNFAIKNTGNTPIRINSVGSSSPRFVGSTAGAFDVPVGGTVNLTVRFNPIAITSYSGAITIRSNAAEPGLLRAVVAGTGYIPGNSPQLQYLSRTPFDGAGGVTPPVGQPGFYTYSILYKHPDGVAPFADFPKVGIDKNNDGDFADDGESLFAMIKEGGTSNWKAGEIYSFTTSLPVSDLYGYQFFATDANGNDALITSYAKGPVVTREILDLHIFASDIVFSKANPAVNENFTVTATVNNNSPYSVSDVPVKFFYRDSLFLFNDTIPFIDANSKVAITHTLNFSPDGFYPIKVWIDSSATLGEGNLLNNYASRPVIVGDFSVPGTIDIVTNATPSGCRKGKVTFTGKANYRGLNLVGTPPVEGAEVSITVFNRFGSGGGATILKTTTDIFGNWYLYDDPCAEDPTDTECEGYECGLTYNYNIEVTDFTLTSPSLAGSVLRACTPCERPVTLSHSLGTSGCILPGQAYNIAAGVINYEIDVTTGKKLCAPTVYKDTITLYVDGLQLKEFTEDSIETCSAKSYAYLAAGLPEGLHLVTMTHTYYLGDGTRLEGSRSSEFRVLPNITDITLAGIFKTGHTSFGFADVNKTCGVPAGAHKIYLYDSLTGYTEKILIDSFFVDNLPPLGSIPFNYNNPSWQVGNHYITIITDVDNRIPELREDNNILKAVFYVQEPDIILKGITISSGSGAPGSLINFSAQVTNAGSPINQPFKVQIKVNGVPQGGKFNIPSLGTGEIAVVVSPPFTVPVSLCPVQITAFADVDKEITEVSETNNADTTYFGININAGRSCDDDFSGVGAGFFDADDILGTVKCVPYIAPKGVITYLATTVRNTGSRDATNIQVQFKLNGETLGTDVIPKLKAGQETESGFYYAFDTVGRFIINAFADYTKVICETDEKDNIGNIHVDIKRSIPDLEVLSQYIAPSNLNPNPGQRITVVASVVNKGDAPAAPSSMRFFVNDIQLGVDIPIDSLYPGQDTTVQATVSYASGIVGPKIIKVLADANKEIVERRETNNEATRAIIVGAAPDFARAKSEAITLLPASFSIGDQVTIRHYVRNYGGDAGAAWIRFYYRNLAGEKVLIDSVRFGMESNDSARISLKWNVTEAAGQIITEIAGSIPPEFNELNNIDSLQFAVALPLTLLSFDGSVRGSTAWLQWRTTSEVNLRHFELERSVDGYAFEKIALVKAQNSTGNHTYNQPDSAFSDIAASKIYYRLQMVDEDGRYRYSNIVILNKKPSASIVKVFPNPTAKDLVVQIASFNKIDYRLQVTDINGKLCMLRQWKVIIGTQTISLPVQMLPAGVYVLLLNGSDGSRQEVKFIKE